MNTNHTPRIARVCVDAAKQSGAVAVEDTESHDGAATPPRGRVRRTRQDRPPTTTNYILGLVSSSRGRETNPNLTLRAGWYV
jgi:hypothetical protein